MQCDRLPIPYIRQDGNCAKNDGNREIEKTTDMAPRIENPVNIPTAPHSMNWPRELPLPNARSAQTILRTAISMKYRPGSSHMGCCALIPSQRMAVTTRQASKPAMARIRSSGRVVFGLDLVGCMHAYFLPDWQNIKKPDTWRTFPGSLSPNSLRTCKCGQRPCLSGPCFVGLFC